MTTTNTAVVHYDPPAPVPAAPKAPAMMTANDLMNWAYAARQAHEIAVQLAETSFVPKSMFRKPGEVTGCILAGRELGLQPMAALRAIDIIDGTPTMRAMTMRALALFHGHVTWVEEATTTRAIVCGQRRGSPHIERAVWTIDDAKKAGLLGKRNWQGYPKDMLVARATAAVVRLVAPDVLLAMPYILEELDGDAAPEPSAAEPPAPAKAKAKTAQRKTAAEPAAPPPADVDFDQPVTVEEDVAHVTQTLIDAGFTVNEEFSAPVGAEPGEPSSRRQLTAMMAGFRDVGLTERAARLAFASQTVGRALGSSTELTKAEASQVIDALNALKERMADDPWPATDVQ